MKKIHVVIILVILFNFLFAMQTGITVGYNSSNNIPTQNEHTVMPGFRLGGISQISLNPFLLQMELQLTSKGFLSQSIGDTRLSNLFLYIELPLSLKYEFLFGDKFNAFVIGGFYAGVKVIAINFVSEIDGTRSFDAGVHTGLGVRYQKLELVARYDQGLVNFDLLEPAKFHQTLSLGVNFYFRGK